MKWRWPLYLYYKKLFLETRPTKRKQFPVNWLTFSRLAFMIQCTKARRSQQQNWRPKETCDVEGLCKNTVKATARPSFLL